MLPQIRPTPETSSALIARFLTSRTETCNQASQDTYAAYVGGFATWLQGRPISSLTISAYLADLRSRKLANATLGNAYRQLKTCCRWLLEHDLLDRDPFVGPGRVRPIPQKRKRRKVYTEEQVVTLLVTAQDRIAERLHAQKYRPSKNPYLLRDAQQSYALVLLLCDSALRAAEVCALDCGQIREEEMIVLSKGGHEDAAFMSALTRAALLELAEGRADDAPLFLDIDQGRCTTRALRGCVQRLAERAGVPLVPRPLHAFRHLCARQWLKAGLGDLTIMQLMRHSQISTTRLYTELDAVELAALHAKASPIARFVAAAQAATTADKPL